MGELDKGTLDKGVAPTSGSSGGIPTWGTKDKGHRSVWPEGARVKKPEGELGWGRRGQCAAGEEDAGDSPVGG